MSETSDSNTEDSQSSSETCGVMDRLQDAKEELTTRLAKNEPGVNALSVFREVDDYDRFDFSRPTGFMTLLAGQMVLDAEAQDEEIWCEVAFDMAYCLLRRAGYWDEAVSREFPNDFNDAIGLYTQILSKNGKGWHLRCHKSLTDIWEEQWVQDKDIAHLQRAIYHLEQAANLSEDEESEQYRLSAQCLRFKVDASAFPCILEIPLAQLSSKPVSFLKATTQKFRFLDARSLAAGESLRVLEFDVLPKNRYMALSYVWRGSIDHDAPPPALGIMSIRGVTDADPISIDVLASICRCVVGQQCELIWIDGVCIIQDNDEDKNWQIQNMISIYKYCKQCVVVPGGLSRLVPLSETTSWIHRAWTLQEALVPESAIFLFSWAHGAGEFTGNWPVPVTVVEPGTSAFCDLQSLFVIHRKGNATFAPSGSSEDDPPISIEVRVLSDEYGAVDTLIGAFEDRGKPSADHAIWRSSLIRVASRPADTVFSIMGLFGVTLDPRAFDPKDRVKPTLALMRGILDQGRNVEWLGVAPHLPLNRHVPSLPMFPVATSGGRAVLQTPDGIVSISEVMGDVWWRLVGLPPGHMAPDGTLTISIRTLGYSTTRLRETDIELEKGSSSWVNTWTHNTSPLYFSSESSTDQTGLILGKIQNYSHGSQGLWIRDRDWLIMLVERCSDGLWKIMGFVDCPSKVVEMDGILEREITIKGGEMLP